MQDICADPIKDGAGETQYVSVEIDTQATDGYDYAPLDNETFKQIPDIAPRAPPVSNPEPRYTVPLDQDEPVVDFKFAKPTRTTPVFRLVKPSADSTAAPLRRGQPSSSEICSGTQESHRKHPGDFSKTTLTIFQRTVRCLGPLQSVKPRCSPKQQLKTTRPNRWWMLGQANALLSSKKTQMLNLQQIYLPDNKSEGLALLQVRSVTIDSPFSEYLSPIFQATLTCL
jgi:hypothetical protein